MPTNLVTTEIYTPDNLLIGNYPHMTSIKKLAAGQGTVLRGTLLGKISGSESTGPGTYKVSLSASVDGTQVPSVIAIENTVGNATEDVNISVFIAGHFSEDHIIYGTGHTANSVRETLRNVNIYIDKTISLK